MPTDCDVHIWGFFLSILLLQYVGATAHVGYLIGQTGLLA